MGDSAKFIKVGFFRGFGFSAWVISGLFLAACHTSDDWRGKIEVFTKNGNPPRMAGDVFSKGNMLLFNVTMGRDFASIIMDMNTGSGKVLVHPLKAIMPLGSNEGQGRTTFFCPATEITECLKEREFKSVGEEVVDGHPCTIYEGDVLYNGHLAKQKIWTPKDLKNVLLLKSLTTVDDGRLVGAHVTDVTYGNLDPDFFISPAGYKLFNTGMLPPGAKLPDKPVPAH